MANGGPISRFVDKTANYSYTTIIFKSTIFNPIHSCIPNFVVISILRLDLCIVIIVVGIVVYTIVLKIIFFFVFYMIRYNFTIQIQIGYQKRPYSNNTTVV